MRCRSDERNRKTFTAGRPLIADHPVSVSAELPSVGRLTVVCAHPDDESFGLGAVVSTLIDRGSRIDLLCFTRGEASGLHAVDGDLSTIRAGELAAAGEVLGIGDTRLLDYADGGLEDQPLDVLVDHVRGVSTDGRADALLTFDRGGITGHPDHVRATEAAVSAAAQLGIGVLAWSLPQAVAQQLNDEFGTTFVGRSPDDIDIEIPVDRTRQLAAIAHHRSQSTTNPVLWRRLELLGNREHLRYFVPLPHAERSGDRDQVTVIR